jgi:hypothetical protein
MALNNEFKVKNSLNTLGQILSSGVDIASIFAPSNTAWTLTAGDEQFNISGTETLTLQGGNGISVRALSSTETVVISGINATSNIRGVASFNSDDFTVTDGAVTIRTGGVDNDQLKTATTENSANYVVIRDTSGGFRAGDITVTGNVSATSHVYAPTIIDSGGNSTQWNHAYDVATTYEQASAGYALSGYNTTIADSVSSVTVGGALPTPASEWKTKTLIQVFDAILFPDLTASYTIPTITFTSPITLNQEVGSVISPVFTTTFTKNDAGALSALYYQRNIQSAGYITLSTVTNPTSSSATAIANQFGYVNPNNPNATYTLAFTDTSYTVVAGTTIWRGVADYQSGQPKQNNKGVVDNRPLAVRLTSNPQLSSAGFVSTTITVNGFRRLFAGTDSTIARAPSSSDEVRAITTLNTLNPAANTAYDLSVPVGATRIVYAYPATLGTANGSGSEPAFKDITNNFDYTNQFVLTTVQVSGLNGFEPVSYNVYTHVPAVPIPGAFTIRMFI